MPRFKVQTPTHSLTVAAQFRRGAAMRKHAGRRNQENK
jgi:hypothetical protein